MLLRLGIYDVAINEVASAVNCDSAHTKTPAAFFSDLANFFQGSANGDEVMLGAVLECHSCVVVHRASPFALHPNYTV